MRRGDYDEAELERQLENRGLMYRFFGKWMMAITKEWQMYPVGVVFGMGFDTATEVALLATTALLATVCRHLLLHRNNRGSRACAMELKFKGAFWNDMANFNINAAGFVIVGIFVVTWAGALVIWRVGHIEEKWSARLQPSSIGSESGR
jgi:high-affinity nickel permease